ncbi:MAG: hypothetical protein ACK58L_08835 [Planctomycetota bacterium]
MRFERKHEPLANRRHFLIQMSWYFIASVILTGCSLRIGVIGDRYFARLMWINSSLNASMILTEMSHVSPIENNAVRGFASVYALFSGVIFLSATVVVFSAIRHRVMHSFHLDHRTDGDL